MNSVEPRISQHQIYDETVCACGESPLWHPTRQQLYWVDITHHKILTRENDKTVEIPYDEFVTALAWIDNDHLLTATETALVVLNLTTLNKKKLWALEDKNNTTRSNDGRADPWGGFWVSTMGKEAEHRRGKIYRYYNNELSVIVPEITIPNGICFDRIRNRAYFADTFSQKLFTLDLNNETGKPQGKPRLFRDFAVDKCAIDGAVVDLEGNIWLGVWDGKAILKLNPNGSVMHEFQCEADRPTCPAFGGQDYTDLFVTTAAIGLEESINLVPEQGKTLVFKNLVKGQPDAAVSLPKGFLIDS